MMPIRPFYAPTLLIAILPFFAMTWSARAQQAATGFAYPTAGQSTEQQQKDQVQCRQWAVDQTGVDPRQLQPPSPPANYYSSSSGSSQGFGSGEVGQGGVVADGARGAATGALLGAIAGDAGKGAAYGALGGAVFGGVKRTNRKNEEARWQQQQQQQMQQQYQWQQQQYQQAMSGFQRAYGACMSSRNYRVQ